MSEADRFWLLIALFILLVVIVAFDLVKANRNIDKALQAAQEDYFRRIRGEQ